MKQDTKTNASGRLKRIAGQVAGIQRMVEDNRYCVDVLLQVASAQAALMETGRVIFAGHVETCLTDALRSDDPAARREKIDELMTVFSRFCRIDESRPLGDVPTKERGT